MKRGKFHFGNVRFGHLAFTVAAASLCITAFAPVAMALPISLGGAADYAILGIGQTFSLKDEFMVYQSDTVVNGNVGVGPNTTFVTKMDARIDGRLDYDTSVTLPSITGTITDGTHQLNMAAIVAAALAADTDYKILAATQTFDTLTEGQTIVGSGGENVIRIMNPVTLKTSLTLQGGPSDSFVFQFLTTEKVALTLSGMNMNLTGGVTADNILWDFSGSGGGIEISSMAAGQTVYGTFLAPERKITSEHGIIDGRLIGGEVWVHSASEINNPAPVPEPATILLLGTGLLALCGFWGARRKFNK